jgi:hypothetical protein
MSVIMMSVIMMSVIMMSVIMMSVIMMSVIVMSDIEPSRNIYFVERPHLFLLRPDSRKLRNLFLNKKIEEEKFRLKLFFTFLIICLSMRAYLL